MDESQSNGDLKPSEKINGHSNGQAPETSERSQTSSEASSSSVDFSAIKSPSLSPTTQTPEKRELLLHNEFVEVPHKLFQNEEFFRSIITKEAFYSLSESARTHLTNNYLPQSMTSNMDDTLDFVFSKSPSAGFVPPLTNVYNRVQAGFYNRPHPYCVQLRDFHKVLHNHFIRNHHMKLLRRLVQSRNQILENACKQGASEEIVPKSRSAKRKPRKDEKLRKRSKKRVAMMLSKVNEIVGVDNVPSSDESGSEDSKIPLTMFREAESTLYNSWYKDCDLDLHQPTEIANLKLLLCQYKELREKNPECPSLDIEDITLEGVYDRVGLSYQSEKNYAQYRCKKQDNAGLPKDRSIEDMIKTENANW